MLQLMSAYLTGVPAAGWKSSSTEHARCELWIDLVTRAAVQDGDICSSQEVTLETETNCLSSEITSTK